jgi:type I restriction enzyme M protein
MDSLVAIKPELDSHRLTAEHIIPGRNSIHMALPLDDLESHLFKCADIIRDAVDPTDYKEYILPLVYYKSISDEFQKQHAANVEEYGEEFARRDNLYDIPVVPEGHFWEDIRNVSDNVDQALNEAFEALTDENPELKGVFRADYIDADALDDNRLGELVEHLSKHDLDRDSVPPDMLGEAYMDLVRHFAEEEGKSGGQFFTPPHIVNLCVRLVDDFEDGMTFQDPTVGSGGMLIEAARYYREEQDGDPSKLTFTGQEINPDIAAIAKMNLSIHGLEGDIEREDSLQSPAFTNAEQNELTRFDRVLANFPFSADWAKDDLQDDPWGRFDWHEKLPRADRGDYAFIMHMAEQLKGPDRGDNSGGKAAIVIPHGVLFRKHESRYREHMLEEDIVEAIVGLPENLFQNNSIPSAVLVLNTDKPAEREGEVQFIHAADEAFYEELSNQNELTQDGLDHIVGNFREWATEERVSRTVSLDEIRENDYNLNIALYVDTTEPEEDIDVEEELAKLRELQAERDAIEAKMDEHMESLNYE